MKIIEKKEMICPVCGNTHDVAIVEMIEETIIKNEKVAYYAQYEYCDVIDEYSAASEMLKLNNVRRKDAYKAKMGLMTSEELITLRKMYKFSQKDLALVLGWGSSTIVRYETTHIQDEAHNDVLVIARDNPSWLYKKLKSKYGEFVNAGKEKAFNKYSKAIIDYLRENDESFIKEIMNDIYIHMDTEEEYYGKAKFEVDKTIELINYIALKVKNLYKVKLMKLLWYCDSLNYKKTGNSITGMAYISIQMGAAPIHFDKLINLKGVRYAEESFYGKNGEITSCKFQYNDEVGSGRLSINEKEVVDKVIDSFGSLSSKEIVEKMHSEVAFKETKHKDMISFEYSNQLSID